MNDTYKTLAHPTLESLYKVKGSKFYGYAFPIATQNEVTTCLQELKKKHPSARHFCYAWQLGTDKITYKTNDDGEPSNSAGKPIYGQLLAFGITNALVVSVRYFGGVKLGVGGLIQAYKTSAKLSLEEAKIVQKTINISFWVGFAYSDMNILMRFIKEHQLQITHQEMAMECQLIFDVRKSHASTIEQLLASYPNLEVKRL